MLDYLSRKVVITEINRFAGYLDEDMINRIQTGINRLPAADVVSNSYALWIPVTNGRGGHECSGCHAYAPSYQSGGEYLSDYCPNCRAKMQKAQSPKEET